MENRTGRRAAAGKGRKINPLEPVAWLAAATLPV